MGLLSTGLVLETRLSSASTTTTRCCAWSLFFFFYVFRRMFCFFFCFFLLNFFFFLKLQFFFFSSGFLSRGQHSQKHGAGLSPHRRRHSGRQGPPLVDVVVEEDVAIPPHIRDKVVVVDVSCRSDHTHPVAKDNLLRSQGEGNEG